jgi:hypothetical protein
MLWIMPISETLKVAKHDSSKLSGEERLEVAMLLLNDLKPLKKMVDEAGFEFFSYLLGMAILETQLIAGGDSTSDASYCEICGSAYDANHIDPEDLSC